VRVSEGCVLIANVYLGDLDQEMPFDTLIMVTSGHPDDELYQALLPHQNQFKSLQAIGDCSAPGTVAAAVYDGHLAARKLESGVDFYEPLFRREMPELG